MPTVGIERTSHPCVLLRCFHDRQQTNHQSCHSPLLQPPAPTSQRDCHAPHGWETNVVSASYWWYHGHCWFCLCLSSICFLGNISMYQTKPNQIWWFATSCWPSKFLWPDIGDCLVLGRAPFPEKPSIFHCLNPHSSDDGQIPILEDHTTICHPFSFLFLMDLNTSRTDTWPAKFYPSNYLRR